MKGYYPTKSSPFFDIISPHKRTINCFALFIALSFISTALFSQNFWDKSTGPYGGRVDKLIKNNKGLLVAVSSSVGITSISTNNGLNWTTTDLGLSLPMVDYIAADSNGIIYASGYISGLDYEFFKSIDQGKSWIDARVFPFNHGVGYIFIDPKNTIYIENAGFGMFRSSDDGITWKNVFGNAFYCMAYSPPNGYLFATTNSSIYRSTDNGLIWNFLRKYDGGNIISVALNGNVIVHVDTDPNNFYHSYFIISTDDGITWTKSNNGIPFERRGYCQGVVVLNDGELITNLDQDLYYSTNNGLNWEKIEYTVPEKILKERFIFESIVKLDSSDLMTATEYGIFFSSDNGRSWIDRNQGLTNTGCLSLALKDDLIFCGTDLTGLFKKKEAESEWINVDLFRKTSVTGIGISPSGNIFVGTYDWVNHDIEGVYFSSDNGTTWIKKNNGMENNYAQQFVFKNDSLIFINSIIGIYYSSNGGESWSRRMNGINSFASWFVELCLDNNGNLLLTTDDGLYRSTNDGNDWEDITSNLPERQLMAIEVTKSNKILVSSTGVQHGVYISSDDGKNWNFSNNGLGNSEVVSLSMNKSGILFAGSFNDHQQIRESAFMSTDNGANWIDISSGLMSRMTGNFKFSRDGYVYAFGSGAVVRSAQPITKIKSINYLPQFTLHQNYPNPISSNKNGSTSTTITFTTREKNIVRIILMDALGRELNVLSNQEYLPGEHSVIFNTTSLPSGMYFYKMLSGNFVEVKKLVVIR